MPSLVFTIMYISGSLLAFLKQSLFTPVKLPLLVRGVLFIKIKEKFVFVHVLVFQIINIILFSVITYFVIIDSEMVNMLYNVYIKVSAALLAFILLVAAVDAHILETKRPPKGKSDETI